MVRPIGDWGSVMNGAHLRMRAKASQRRQLSPQNENVRFGQSRDVRFSRGPEARWKKFAGQLGRPGALESVFFATLIVVEYHQSFEVPDAHIEFVENSICDPCRACHNLRWQFTGPGPRAI